MLQVYVDGHEARSSRDPDQSIGPALPPFANDGFGGGCVLEPVRRQRCLVLFGIVGCVLARMHRDILPSECNCMVEWLPSHGLHPGANELVPVTKPAAWSSATKAWLGHMMCPRQSSQRNSPAWTPRELPSLAHAQPQWQRRGEGTRGRLLLVGQ